MLFGGPNSWRCWRASLLQTAAQRSPFAVESKEGGGNQAFQLAASRSDLRLADLAADGDRPLQLKSAEEASTRRARRDDYSNSNSNSDGDKDIDIDIDIDDQREPANEPHNKPCRCLVVVVVVVELVVLVCEAADGSLAIEAAGGRF